MEKVNIDSSNGELFFLKFILVIRDIDLVNPVYFIHFYINEIFLDNELSDLTLQVELLHNGKVTIEDLHVL